MHRDALVELLVDDALELYETKEQSIGADNLREIERRVMLSVIDQHWREHLYEMDYLREGINLRAMGQKDPLAEWQREGFDMFEAMMGQIEDDFVHYVSHLQVATVADAPQAPSTKAMKYSSAEDSVQGAAALRATAASMAPEQLLGDFDPDGGGMPVTNGPVTNGPVAGGMAEEVVLQPVRVEKTPGRNEPCFCGSGKKYKLCHGR